jgi:hypothetical protein
MSLRIIITHGAYCRFDPGAARRLAELLRAVAGFASGGMSVLEARKTSALSSCSLK